MHTSDLVAAREDDERLGIPVAGLRRDHNLCILFIELVKNILFGHEDVK